MSALVVVAAGVATTIQDHGRPGLAGLGVPRSGAVDVDLHDLVNRLVGNGPDAATLETAGALVLRAEHPVIVAASAEDGPRALAAGDIVRVDPAAGEQWAYLAVRGGIAVDPVLGSRSRDTLSAIGPTLPASGDRLPIGPDPGTPIVADVGPRRVAGGDVVVRMWPGPRLDRLDDAARHAWWSATWTVSPDVSRVGARLRGPALAVSADDLPSEGLVLGAVQLPPDGEPVVMLADHPTTGGYPVIGVVDPADVAAVAQARPGTSVRVRPR